MDENSWQALYNAAILEVDPFKLEARVNTLEEIIRARQALDGEVSPEERAAMQTALDALGVLKIDRCQSSQ